MEILTSPGMNFLCKGKHLCLICGDIYKCEAMGECIGDYGQYCNKHSISTMVKQHVKDKDL